MSGIITGSSSTFKYGADGLRRQKTTNGTSTDYAYDGTMLVREGHATGGTLTASTVTANYLIGARGPEYRRDDTQTQTDGQGHTFGKTGWYVYDGLGSVVGEVDPLGNVTSSPKYDVYGAVRSNSGTASTKQGFVGSLGHLSEPETGLIYMRARYYDPSVGRFVSEDPARNGMNWLVYCSNNRVNRVDQTGKFDTDTFFAALAGACLGGLIGFFRGGVLGALIGAMLGGALGAASWSSFVEGNGEKSVFTDMVAGAFVGAAAVVVVITAYEIIMQTELDDDDPKGPHPRAPVDS